MHLSMQPEWQGRGDSHAGVPWSDRPTIGDLFWCLAEQGSYSTFFQIMNAGSPLGTVMLRRAVLCGALGSLPGPAHSMPGTPLVTTTDG